MRPSGSILLSVLVVVWVCACASSPPSQFYTLSPEATAAPSASTSFPHTIAVGPVNLPEAVNRPQFVVRDGPNEVRILESHRWAEPLKSGIAQAVAGYMGRDLADANVIPMTQSAANDAQYYVAIDVQRFDLIVGDAALLDIVWTIKRRGGGDPLVGRSTLHEPVQTSSDPFDALVAAQARALASVSREIAQRLSAAK